MIDYIPTEIAVCPECGGQLEIVGDFNPTEDITPHIACENDEISESENFHRGWQSEWQPIIDKVTEHLRKNPKH